MDFTCATCTFKNLAAAWPVCTMCGTRASQDGNQNMIDVTQSEPTAVTVTCVRCTFANDVTAVSCALCGMPLDASSANLVSTQHSEQQQAIFDAIAGQKKAKEAEEAKERQERIEVIKKQHKKQDNKDIADIFKGALKLLSAQPEQAHVQEQAYMFLKRLYEYVPANGHPSDREGDEDKDMAAEACAVCGCDFDHETVRLTTTHCAHSTACTDCFRQYVHHRVKAEDVLPYLPCPAPDCQASVAPSDFRAAGVPATEVLLLIIAHCKKLLLREDDWVECCQKKCSYGFLLPALDDTAAVGVAGSDTGGAGGDDGGGGGFFGFGGFGGRKHKRKGKDSSSRKGSMSHKGEKEDKQETCAVCGTAQKVQRKALELDSEFKKMIEKGELRPCPKCNHLTMKEYGVCNVIECAKCNVWWNWRTRETGQSSRELKAKSRSRGTLWEPGELQFQVNLQQREPEKFKALLERNGVKYDPNYRRGGW